MTTELGTGEVETDTEDADEFTPLVELWDLTERVALVTGGAQGIGFGIARRLHQAGAQVVIADHNAERGAAAVERLGERAIFVSADLAVEQQIVDAVASAAEWRGRLDILVNNAAIFGGSTVAEMETSVLDATMAIDLRAPFLVCREAIPHLKRHPGAAIVNVSSLNAFRAPRSGTAHYDAAKAGLLAMTRSLSIELGRHGVRVNAVAPGVSLTEGQRQAFGMDPGATAEDYPAYYRNWLSRTPVSRPATADDQARAVLFLVSRAAAYITGHCLVVDGGAHLV